MFKRYTVSCIIKYLQYRPDREIVVWILLGSVPLTMFEQHYSQNLYLPIKEVTEIVAILKISWAIKLVYPRLKVTVKSTTDSINVVCSALNKGRSNCV